MRVVVILGCPLIYQRKVESTLVLSAAAERLVPQPWRGRVGANSDVSGFSFHTMDETSASEGQRVETLEYTGMSCIVWSP